MSLSALRTRRGYVPVTAVAIALVAALLTAAGAAAAGPVRLSNGSVSPADGTTATVFTFTVTYSSTTDTDPKGVWVVLDGQPTAMAPAAPDTVYRDGAVFALATTLTAGTHSYSFLSQDAKTHAEKVEATLPGGTVTVTMAVATPSGTGSTGTGSSAGTGASGASPGGTTSGAGTGGSTAGAATGVDGTATTAATDGTGGDATGGPSSVVPAGAWDEHHLGFFGAAAGAAGPAYDPARQPDEATGLGAQRAAAAGQPGAGTAGSGSTGSDAVLPGTGGESLPGLALIVSTASAVLIAWAFFTFGRRRDRDEEGVNRSAQPHPWNGHAVSAQDVLLAQEASLPRWRRPSLMMARRSTPDRLAPERRLTFQEPLPGVPGVERWSIRYRLVRLTDTPDEVLGRELLRLDAGDEVEVLERAGLYLRVRCPDGTEGWLHKMTLGERVVDAPGDLSDDEVGESVLRALHLAPSPRLNDEPGLAAQFVSRRTA